MTKNNEKLQKTVILATITTNSKQAATETNILKQQKRSESENELGNCKNLVKSKRNFKNQMSFDLNTLLTCSNFNIKQKLVCDFYEEVIFVLINISLINLL